MTVNRKMMKRFSEFICKYQIQLITPQRTSLQLHSLLLDKLATQNLHCALSKYNTALFVFFRRNQLILGRFCVGNNL